jgi:hypothetical protein
MYYAGGGGGAGDPYYSASPGQSGRGQYGNGGTGGYANSGASGIVIIRYSDSFPDASYVSPNGVATTTGGYKYYTFYSAGSITL